MADEYDIVSDLSEEGADLVAPGLTDTQEPSTSNDELSLRDQLSSAIKGEDATPDAARQDGGLVRDPTTGKFVAREAPVDGGEFQQQTVARPPNLEIADEVFASLPLETQDYLARTAEFVNDQMQRWQSYDSIEQLIGPRRNAWAMNGLSEAQAVSQLFALSDFATQDPAAFVHYFAQNNNVDLEELVFGFDDEAANIDPAISQLQSTVQQLQQELQGRNHAEQQATHERTVNHVLQFLDEKDGSGKLLRPYASELGNDFMVAAQTVKAQNPHADMRTILQDAYERACWSNPAVRVKMQKASGALTEAERLQQRAEQAARARNAGSSVPSGVPSTSGEAPVDRSMREEIQAAMRG